MNPIERVIINLFPMHEGHDYLNHSITLYNSIDSIEATPDNTVIESLHFCIDIDHLMYDSDIHDPTEEATRIVKIVKKFCEQVTVTKKVMIWAKGIPQEVMLDINHTHPVNPFLPYFKAVQEIRNQVIHRLRNWPLETGFEFLYTSAFGIKTLLETNTYDYTWSPWIPGHGDQDRCKPAGAMFSKARHERIHILNSMTRGLADSEFIYSIHPPGIDIPRGNQDYDWKQIHHGDHHGDQENPIQFKPNFYDKAIVDPIIRDQNLAATGFNSPAFLYDNICLEIVAETEVCDYRCDVSEKLTRPMLLGMPFLTNSWYDHVLKMLGGKSYWDLLDISMPTIRYVDWSDEFIRPPDNERGWQTQKPVSMKYIDVAFLDCDNGPRSHTNYMGSDVHQKLNNSNLIKGVRAFRNKCKDANFHTEVQKVIDHNRKVMMDHCEKYSDYMACRQHTIIIHGGANLGVPLFDHWLD